MYKYFVLAILDLRSLDITTVATYTAHVHQQASNFTNTTVNSPKNRFFCTLLVAALFCKYTTSKHYQSIKANTHR